MSLLKPLGTRHVDVEPPPLALDYGPRVRRDTVCVGFGIAGLILDYGSPKTVSGRAKKDTMRQDKEVWTHSCFLPSKLGLSTFIGILRHLAIVTSALRWRSAIGRRG